MPKICNKAVNVLLKMRLQCVQNVIKIMSKYVSGICKIFSKSDQCLSKKCSINVDKLYKIC